MTKRGASSLATAIAAVLFLSGVAWAQDIFIADILARPERFYNRTVTIVGRVEAIQPAQPGTNRGQYTIVDKLSPNPLTVRTDSLPKSGSTYRITGTLIADPAQGNVPVLMEENRASVGGVSTTTIIIIVAVVALLLLLVLLLRVMAKSKTGTRGAPVIHPAAKPAAPSSAVPDAAKTLRIPPAVEPTGAKTQMFLNLGAAIVVEKGDDAGKEFPLHLLVVGIGRPGSRKNDIELTDGTVSKEQATIRYDNVKKEFTLTNESKTNPTRVNGEDMTGPKVLIDGTVIEMGKTVLRFKKG